MVFLLWVAYFPQIMYCTVYLVIGLNASSLIAMQIMSRFKYLFLSSWDIKNFNKSRVAKTAQLNALHIQINICC